MTHNIIIYVTVAETPIQKWPGGGLEIVKIVGLAIVLLLRTRIFLREKIMRHKVKM